MVVLHLECLVQRVGAPRQDLLFRRGPGTWRSSEPVNLARVVLRWKLQSNADSEFGLENSGLCSCFVVEADRSYLELLPRLDTVVAASGVDIVEAGIVGPVAEGHNVVVVVVVGVGIDAALASEVDIDAVLGREVDIDSVLASEVDIDSDWEPIVQPKQFLVQWEWVCLY